MMRLFVAEILVVLAAVVATWWLRREGDRAWRRRRSKVGQIQVRIVADVEPFVHAMRKAARELERMLPPRPLTRQARMRAWVRRVSRGVL